MPKSKTLAQLGETPQPDDTADFEFPEREGFAPRYRPNFEFGFEPQQYASELPQGWLPDLSAQQFATTREPFRLPTGALTVPVPLGRLGELQLRGDYTRNPYGAPDFSLGFGFTRRF